MCVCAAHAYVFVCCVCAYTFFFFFFCSYSHPAYIWGKTSQVQISEAMGMLPNAVTPCVGWLVDAISSPHIQTHIRFFCVCCLS